MTNRQLARSKAERAASRDYRKGLPPDPGRHGARDDSLFAKWYYRELIALSKT